MSKYTMEEYTALKAAYAEGVQEVHYADRTVKYFSAADMKKILEEMEGTLFPSTSKKRRRSLFSLRLHD